jgi:hypothetical protein
VTNIREYSSAAASEIFNAIGATPSEEQTEQAVKIVEQAVIKAVLDVRSQCVDAALNCAPADQDTAHKIATEIRQANNLLIANLSSMR